MKSDEARRKKLYVERDISWMYFNQRILLEAARPEVPLLEQLTFLGIYSNNLDEFFRVRVATLNRIVEYGDKNIREERDTAARTLKQIGKLHNQYYRQFEETFASIMEKLKQENIHVIKDTELTPEQELFITSLYRNRLNGSTNPLFLNKTSRQPDDQTDEDIYLAIRLQRKDGEGKVKVRDYAVIELPTNEFGRFIRLPDSDGKTYLMFLDDVIRYCLPMIPASISFWIINASDMFFVQALCEDYGGRTGNHWVGLLSAGYFLPQIITILGSIFYEAWQLSAVTEETDREAFFSKIFRVYASVLFCCVAGIIMLCQLLMRVFKAEYFDAWTFVPFLTLCSMLTCMNQFLNSIYVVYKRSTGSLVTMLAGAVLNLILNYCFIRLWGPWGVTLASFLSLMLVFLLRAYSTRGLLEIDFHPAWLILNLALVLAEIWCMMKLTHWALPVVGITAVICVMNIREVLSMLDTLIGKFLKKKKA